MMSRPVQVQVQNLNLLHITASIGFVEHLLCVKPSNRWTIKAITVIPAFVELQSSIGSVVKLNISLTYLSHTHTHPAHHSLFPLTMLCFTSEYLLPRDILCSLVYYLSSLAEWMGRDFASLLIFSVPRRAPGTYKVLNKHFVNEQINLASKLHYSLLIQFGFEWTGE